jgi:hypothetical protein
VHHSERNQQPRLNLPAGTVGAISEILAAADLMKRGYDVFRALSPSCSCDLIAIAAGQPPLRIEVRTGNRSPVTGHLSFPRNGHSRKFVANGTLRRSHSPERTEADLDHYCVIVHASEEIIYEPPLPESPGDAP